MLALIDADIILYRVGFSSQDVEERFACIRADDLVKRILDDVGATDYQLWFSDSLVNNYRYQIDKNYKLSRQSQPKPKHYSAIKDFLKGEWNAQTTHGQEADDELGIRQSSGTSNGTVICTTDKDLKQVAGQHYNFVQRRHFFVEPFEGTRHFYSQFLIGDRTDDIEGVRGFGPVYTTRLLEVCRSEIELFQRVREKYQDDERLLKNGRLLWVRRVPNQMWEFPSSGGMETTTMAPSTTCENSDETGTEDLQDEGRIEGSIAD